MDYFGTSVGVVVCCRSGSRLATTLVDHYFSVATYDPERFYSKSGQNPEPKVCKIQRKSGVKMQNPDIFFFLTLPYNFEGTFTFTFETRHNNHLTETLHNKQFVGHHCDLFTESYLNETGTVSV